MKGNFQIFYMLELQVKDLTKEPPRSPFVRLGGFSILARTIDKCRAQVAGTLGNYEFNCGLDQMLFKFIDMNADDFKEHVSRGHNDEAVLLWMKEYGVSKTDEEITVWSNGVDTLTYYHDSEEHDWFVGECARLGLDPQKTSLFQYLDEDDKISFGK